MGYEERNTWVGLVGSVIAMAVYTIAVLQQADGGPLTEVVWWPIMLWTIGIGVVVMIVSSILWGIVAGMRDPEGATRSDLRDRDISRMGSRVGQAFLAIAGVGVIVLCAIGADRFWIANTMFFGFALSAFVGGLASVIAYRRGLV
ncbi:hypothetical protein [Microbacterium lacus]|uniref:DUF2178 domain-containing protein n=1 Tax=Microbacterium lacus TaxID=415217 RepID=A0ABP4TCB7_9MICO